MSEEKLHWVREHETDCTRQPFGDGRGATLASAYNIEAARIAPKQIRCRGNKTGRIKGGLSMSPA